MLTRENFFQFTTQLTHFERLVKEQKQKMLACYQQMIEFPTEFPFNLEDAFQNPDYVGLFTNYPITPLTFACQLGFVELVQYILIKNPCLEWVGQSGDTISEKIYSLREAIAYKQHNVLAFLLQAGFSPVKRDLRKNAIGYQCPLAYAIKLNNTEAVKLLVKFGAGLDDITSHQNVEMTVREFIEQITADTSTTKHTSYDGLNGHRKIVEYKLNYSLTTEMLELLFELKQQDDCIPKFTNQ